MNTCQPVELCTMHGNGMVTWWPFHVVTCQPYPSEVWPKRISATSISASGASDPSLALRMTGDRDRANVTNMTFHHLIAPHTQLPY